MNCLKKIARFVEAGDVINLRASLAEYYEEIGKEMPRNLDDVEWGHARKRLGTILGFKKASPTGIRRALVEHNVFPHDLSDDFYTDEDREDVAGNCLKGRSQIGAYFTPLTQTENENAEKFTQVLEHNREFIGGSKGLELFLIVQGYRSLDDIDDRSSRLHTLFRGIANNNRQTTKLRRALVKYGAFSDKLAKYDGDTVEHIAERIFEQIGKRKDVNTSFYFSEVDDETLEDNRAILLGTYTFGKFAEEQDITFEQTEDGITTVGEVNRQTSAARSFFYRYLGLGEGVKTKSKGLHIHVLWSEEDIERLRNLVGDDPKGFQKNLRGDMRAEWETAFGRSFSGIEKKARTEGFLTSKEGSSRKHNYSIHHPYPFPQIHQQEFPGMVAMFNNIADLFERDVTPDFVPVLGYDSVGHNTYIHATLPIRHKGAEIENYTANEQQGLRTITEYLTRHAELDQKDNDGVHISVIRGTEEPHLLIREKDDGTRYVQLLVERKGHDPQLPVRQTITTGNTTYLSLRHEHPSFDDVRGRIES